MNSSIARLLRAAARTTAYLWLWYKLVDEEFGDHLSEQYRHQEVPRAQGQEELHLRMRLQQYYGHNMYVYLYLC
jgi:hypothetical protein